MDRPVRKTEIIYLRNIPADTKARYKAYCANRGRSMTKDLIEYMKECVVKDLL